VEPERPWDIFLEEANERLKVEESNFHRPFIKTIILKEEQTSGLDQSPVVSMLQRMGNYERFSPVYMVSEHMTQKQTQFLNHLKGIEAKVVLLCAGLLITRMGLESNGSHTVQWPPLLI
jgi:hypothetical protein